MSSFTFIWFVLSVSLYFSHLSTSWFAFRGICKGVNLRIFFTRTSTRESSACHTRVAGYLSLISIELPFQAAIFSDAVQYILLFFVCKVVLNLLVLMPMVGVDCVLYSRKFQIIFAISLHVWPGNCVLALWIRR